MTQPLGHLLGQLLELRDILSVGVRGGTGVSEGLSALVDRRGFDQVELASGGDPSLWADVDAAAARQLAADGFRVGILSSSGRGETLAGELEGISVTGSSQSLEDLGRLVDLAMARWGRVDLLLNSTGHGLGAPLLAIPTSRLEIEMMPSFAPKVAARNQPMRWTMCS